MEPKSNSRTLRAPQTRLDRACNYLEDKWFPCSNQVLLRLEPLLQQPISQANHESILECLEQDYSLTLFCYKELCVTEQDQPDLPSPEFEEGISALNAVKACPPEQLLALLKKSLPILKLHPIESAEGYQTDRLREALLALITTKTLCEHTAIDPDLGAEVSLLRQIGYLLIAWNYPTIYQRASSQITDTHSLDDNLVKALGFSPSSLALSLAEKWGLGGIFKQSAQKADDDSILNQNELNGIAQSISKLCLVGEKLARANNPELYPSALHDWEDAKQAIEETLGKEGLALIDQAMTLECEELFIHSPFVFKAGTLLNLEDKLQGIESKRIAERNPYLEQCSGSLKTELLNLYDLIAAGEKAERTVNVLLRKILPIAGFSSSALFTLEPGTKRLALQLKAGDIKLRTGTNLQDLHHKSMQDIVPLAFHSPEVLCHDGKLKGSLEESNPACLATFFGCSQRFGVFYVELPSPDFQKGKSDYQDRLRALAFTLNDCLELV